MAYIENAKYASASPLSELDDRPMADQPQEPKISNRSREILSHLRDAMSVLDEIDKKLSGSNPLTGMGSAEPKNPSEPGICENLAKACELAANLAGYAKTLNSKL